MLISASVVSACTLAFCIKAAEDSNLISGFDVPEGSDKVAEDEFDPIPVLITKNPQGKQEDGENRRAEDELSSK